MYTPSPVRYDSMKYRPCGKSGLKISFLSLGLWHNFGAGSDRRTTEEIVRTAFDSGINSFDLANNYGPPAGAAEERFGEILRTTLSGYRDEIVVSTKAGYEMWPGPFGDGGSRKYLTASLDQSLKRLGLDYVDIFYHHRPDPSTPLEETASALSDIVRSGKALYVALSNYGEEIFEIERILREDYRIHPIVNQVSYSILNRRGDRDGTLFPRLKADGIGVIAFSPLSQGRLTDKYLSGIIPEDSRAAGNGFLRRDDITPEVVSALNSLNAIAAGRGQKLSQMALNWVLEREGMTSAIVGARTPGQLGENLRVMKNYASFTEEEEERIEECVKGISFRR